MPPLQPVSHWAGLGLGRPCIMGIVNVTLDSFRDGGRLMDTRTATDACLAMTEDGAGMSDVGGESTRPGAFTVPPRWNRTAW